jgi:hypothetical protein
MRGAKQTSALIGLNTASLLQHEMLARMCRSVPRLSVCASNELLSATGDQSMKNDSSRCFNAPRANSAKKRGFRLS